MPRKTYLRKVARSVEGANDVFPRFCSLYSRASVNAYHTCPWLYLRASRNGERRHFRVNVACRLKCVKLIALAPRYHRSPLATGIYRNSFIARTLTQNRFGPEGANLYLVRASALHNVEHRK